MRSFHFSTWVGTRLVVIVAIALLALIVTMSAIFPPSHWIPAQQWGAMLAAAGIPGMGIFLIVSSLATSIGLPRQLVAFIAGLAYGFGAGVFLSLLAALSGCYLSVRISRRFLAQWVSRRYPGLIAQLHVFLENDIFMKVLALRLQPFGTNLLTNLCIGFLKTPITTFMAATAVGYVPQMTVFSLLGSGVRVGSQAQMLLSLVLLGVSIGLGAVLFKRHQSRG